MATTYKRIDQLAAATNVGNDDMFVIEQSSTAKRLTWKTINNQYIRTNRNILDNWCFINPVNQRGVTSFKGSACGLDRWMNYGTDNVTVGSGYIQTPGTSHICQRVENMASTLLGVPITMSILTKSGSMRTGTGIVNSLTAGNVSFNTEDGYALYWDELSTSFAFKAPDDEQIVAVKLELGREQTLAYLYEGKWWLNEYPDYGSEYTKCRRYYIPGFTDNITIAHYIDGAGLVIDLPFEPMRVTPTLSDTSQNALVGATWKTVSGGVCRSFANGKMQIVYTSVDNLGEEKQIRYAVNKCPALIADL